VYLANSTFSFAQEPPPQTLTLDAAVELAQRNFPAIHVAKAQAQAASEQIGLAHTAYLPRLDLLWQENRASTNNIFGALLPPSYYPADIRTGAGNEILFEHLRQRGRSALLLGTVRFRSAKS